MNVDYNPYEGREVTGVTDTVISRGKVVIDGGKFTGRAGAGSFAARWSTFLGSGARPRRG